ncbi:MAG TPA: ISNCY family transposase [bacterium]|nr:ISNCY family transposase [bacterium]
MLRLRDPQGSLWDQLLSPQARTLSAELTAVDGCLADERFFEPYLRCFRTLVGRPTVPVETYLRLMYLKHRYRLGYEMLVREVTDSLHWRRFCHLALDAPVPHPTTLSKLTRKYGPDIVHELNRLLVQRATEQKLLRSRKLRVDTTVVQAPIDYPTDIGLLADSARMVTRTVRHLHAAGAAVRTAFRSRARSIKRALAAVGRSLRMRTDEAKAAVLRQTARVLRCTRQISRQAQRVLRNSRYLGQHVQGRTAALVQRTRLHLRRELQLAARVMEQARLRIRGTTTIPDRLVSVFDPEARPIRRGKLSARTEFGYKALLTETEDRVITHYEVYVRNPEDGGLLPAAVAGHTQTVPRTPHVVATDRGFGAKDNEELLRNAGVKWISLPYKGRLGAGRAAHERQRWFRRQQRWRSGQEATISLGSRKYAWRHSRLRGRDGADLWLGFGILTHNLDRMVVIDAKR